MVPDHIAIIDNRQGFLGAMRCLLEIAIQGDEIHRRIMSVREGILPLLVPAVGEPRLGRITKQRPYLLLRRHAVVDLLRHRRSRFILDGLIAS